MLGYGRLQARYYMAVRIEGNDYRAVAEHFLHHFGMDVAHEQVGSRRVTKVVRRRSWIQSCRIDCLLEDPRTPRARSEDRSRGRREHRSVGVSSDASCLHVRREVFRQAGHEGHDAVSIGLG